MFPFIQCAVQAVFMVQIEGSGDYNQTGWGRSHPYLLDASQVFEASHVTKTSTLLCVCGALSFLGGIVESGSWSVFMM